MLQNTKIRNHDSWDVDLRKVSRAILDDQVVKLKGQEEQLFENSLDEIGLD